jgi:hypothetical protein
VASRVRLEHVVLLSAASGFVACATILGIEDRNLDTQGIDSSIDSAADVVGAESSREASTDATSDLSVVADVSTGDAGNADSISGDGGTSRDASPVADGSSTDAVGVDVVVSDGASGDAGDAGSDAGVCADPCVLATGLNHPFLIASDANSVYWTEFGDSLGAGNGGVKACPVAGCGTRPMVYASGLTNARGIAVDGTNIYFSAAGAIYSCPLSGCVGGPSILTAAGSPYGVAVDATYVYWVDDSDNTAHRVPKTGGGASQVVYDAGDGVVYRPFKCVADGTYLYFMDYDENAFRLPVAGGPLAFLGSGNNGGVFGNSFGITTDPANVYFGGNGVVLRADKLTIDSGAPISSTVRLAAGLAWDPTTSTLYWADWGSGNGNDGTVGKMASDGGSAQLLVASLATPEAITISGNNIFWLSNGALDDAGTGFTVPSTGALIRRAK